MSDDYIQQHTARIEFDNKIEYAIFYEKTGLQLDDDVTYPSLESAQWTLQCQPDADQLVIYQRPTPKDWKSVK